MKPFNIYFWDFSYRCFYIIFSYVFCLTLLFFNINSLFIFETIPLLSLLTNKRLILTQITQIFNTILFSSIFLSLLFMFPLVIYHLNAYFSNSWYTYQKSLYLKSLNYYFFIFLLTYVLIHFFLLPNLLSFFLYWEITEKTSFLKIEAEISLFYYIMWSLLFKYTISLVCSMFCSFIFLVINFFKINYLYQFFKKFKTVNYFIILCLTFFLIPPDFGFQTLLSFIFYILFEFIFLLICTNIYIKTIYLKDAYNKTIIKIIHEN